MSLADRPLVISSRLVLAHLLVTVQYVLVAKRIQPDHPWDLYAAIGLPSKQLIVHFSSALIRCTAPIAHQLVWCGMIRFGIENTKPGYTVHFSDKIVEWQSYAPPFRLS